MKSERQTLWIIVFVIAAASAAFAVYYNVLWNDFIWDDHIVLKNQVGAFHSAQDIFFPPEGIPQFSLHYYRPLVMLSYIADHAIWGKSPFGFHLTGILLHILTTVLVFFISRIILKGFEHREAGALIASLVFAVHPIHTESVAWMAGRSDVMAAVFFFLSLLFYLKFKEKNQVHWLALSSVIFLLAALAKETSLSLILLLPVIDVVLFSEKVPSVELVRYERKRKERVEKKKKEKEELSKRRKDTRAWTHAINIFSYIPFLIATVIYLIVRHYALRGGIKKALQTSDFLEIPKIIINSYGFYIEKIFLPINLKAVIHDVPSGFWTTIVSIAILAVLLAGIVFSFVKKHRVLLFSIIFFVLTLVPSIMVAVLKISETPLAERYLYIPSLSFSLFIAFVVLYIPARLQESARAVATTRPILLVLVCIMLLVFSIQTVRRNTVWKDDILFWEDLVKKDPDQGYPHLHLGITYSKNGRIEDAEKEYIKAAESRFDAEGRSIAFNNLGNIYLGKKDYDRAEQCFTKAISIWGSYPTPYYSMALSHWKRYLKDYREGKKPDARIIENAVEFLNRSIQLNPYYTKAHGLLGELLYRLGQYDEARKHLETTIKYEYDKEGITAKGAKQLLDKIPAK